MITNQFGEQYLYAVNRGMFEQESAKDRIEREFGELLSREDSLIIFIGSDSGNIIRYIQSRDFPLGTRYIFIEPAEYLEQVSAHVDLDPEEEKIALVARDQLNQALKAAGIISYLYVNGVVLKRSLSAEYGYVKQYRAEYWSVDTLLNDVRWNALLSIGLDKFIERQLQNSADDLHPLSEIRGCLEGKTVIVLGGGPSLDEHLDWIQTNRSRLVVFAVSRISARLQQVGLTPDFVFSVDPYPDKGYLVSKEMLNFGPEVIFVNHCHVAPWLPAQWPHRKFYSGQLLPWESDLNPEDNFQGSGPTVTNSAISAAAWLGCRQIILAGVDLCYTPEGFTHAHGSKERAAGPQTDLSGVTVMTNAGRLANTKPDLAIAVRTLRRQAYKLSQSGVSIINISENAAKVEFVEYRPPANIVLSDSVYDHTEVQPAPLDKRESMVKLEIELNDKISQLKILQDLIRKASEIHESMYKGDLIESTLKEELEEVDRTMESDHPELLKLSKTLAIRSLLRMAQPLRDMETLEPEYIKKKLAGYYKSLSAGALRLQTHITNGAKAVELRLAELSLGEMSAEELKFIAKRWGERGEMGRLRCFDLDPKAQNILSSDGQTVMATVAATENYFEALSLSEKARNLQMLPSRMQQLKDTGDLEALEALASALETDPEAAPYMPLVTATLFQMKQQPQEALEALLPVMEQPDSPVLEQVLAKMVGLTSELGYQQAVLDAAAGLASLNALYLNNYADALMANGQFGDAIEHLTEYLRYFPGDKLALNKLGRWYSEQGNEEGVSLVKTLIERFEAGE